MKSMLAILCVFGAVAACWLAVMEGVLQHPAFSQRMLIAVSIGAQSVLTLIVVSGTSNRLWRIASGAGALWLLVMGSLAVVKNATGHDFEGFALVIGVALVAQALLTFWMTLRGASPAASALQ